MQFTAGRKLRASELNYDTETGVDAHYRHTISQTITSAVFAPIIYGATVRTTPLLTRVNFGVGHAFTINRAGVWNVTGHVRLNNGVGAAGARFLSVVSVGTGATLYEQGFSVATNAALSLVVGGPLYFAAGDQFYIGYYADGGASVTTNATNDWVSLRAAWTHD